MPTPSNRTIGAILGALLLTGTVVGVGVAVATPTPEEAWRQITDEIAPALQAEDDARRALTRAQAQLAEAEAAVADARAAATAASEAKAATKPAADAAEASMAALADVELPPDQAESGQITEIRRMIEARHAEGGTP